MRRWHGVVIVSLLQAAGGLMLQQTSQRCMYVDEVAQSLSLPGHVQQVGLLADCNSPTNQQV
jgi:hypothetical protein